MEKVQVFILHWASSEHLWPNFFTLEAVHSIRSLTPPSSYELIVVDNHSEPTALEALKSKLPSDVRVVENDRSSQSVASGRNKVWSLVDSNYFVLLHPDVKVTRGWLSNFVAELKMAEQRYRKPCVITPTYVPYPLLDEEAFKRFSGPGHFVVNHELNVSCKPPGFWTDDGHQLMIFAASKWFRDIVGEWDERYTGANYDDCDMGITAILKGCKNLISHTTFIHHLQSMSKGFGALWDSVTNSKVFIKKWGKEMWNEMETGQLWIRLHREHP
jgi:GT2 family glycosyltransferase